MQKYAIHFTRSMLSDTFRGVSAIKKSILGSRVFKNVEIYIWN